MKWRWATFVVALLAIVIVVWVIPAVRGPTLECIDIAPAACDQAWRAEVARTTGLHRAFPVTTARVRGSHDASCRQVNVEWLWGVFGATREEFC